MKKHFDPLQILDISNTSFDLETFKNQGEDICQFHKTDDLVIDLGYYTDIFKIHVIKNENWDEPLEEYQSDDLNTIIEKFRDLLQG